MGMPEYRELVPPPRLADSVECFWFMRPTEKFSVVHRVTPDGCADILFTRCGGGVTLQVVGPMTRFEDFELSLHMQTVGVRFRPGMWLAQIGVRGDRITDMILPLEDLWGARARTLLDGMAEEDSAQECASLLAQSIRSSEKRTQVQQAIEWMERRRGCVSLDWVARSGRTGLSPKFLARVLRFRHAHSRLGSRTGEHAGLAADCGYTDQSHFIAEFQHFAGQTPSSYLRSRAR